MVLRLLPGYLPGGRPERYGSRFFAGQVVDRNLAGLL